VTRSDVLSLTDDNPAATIIGDLATGEQIQDGSFDCIVLTQTLHLIHDIGAAVDTAFRALRPGGVALVTVPGITQLERVESWHWSLTPASATRLFTDRFGAANIAVESHGNVLAATAFLFGLATEELTADELDYEDHDYPVTVAVRAVRPDRDA
jgi:SAM-dependent methyltransferase